jgi:diaminopimelate epimerase
MHIPFTKMSGSGNDFIVIDNRKAMVTDDMLPQFVERVCRRKLSAGADGLILVEDSKSADFKWRFFNSDGSVAEMCGNGARCVARFAYLNGIAKGSQMAFETIAGVIHAQVLAELVKIRMTDPQELRLNAILELDDRKICYSSVNTGVPHVVLSVDNIESADVVGLGRAIRHHAGFAPAGTNVNFLAPQEAPKDEKIWAVRTYERGVEDETLACGTGIVASALVLAEQKGLVSPVTLMTRSGGYLKVYYSKDSGWLSDIYLEGDARVIYEGRLMRDAWEYE